MYAVTAGALDAWRHIFAQVSRDTDVLLDFIEYPAPAPLERLWSRPDLGAVFMCGWPYTMAGYRHRLIAAPVPAAERYGGQPVYFTDFVVKRDSVYRRLADTFGESLAWTAAHSHSGYNAVRYHLLAYRTSTRTHLYSETVGPVLTPEGALRSVLEDRVSVAPLDSWVRDIWLVHNDERVLKCRVVESSEYAPIPPLVASPRTDAETCNRLREAFLAIHHIQDMRPHLESLALSRFCEVNPTDYRVIAQRAEHAIQAGYPVPA
jgi:ABC-type phosphate/phosphonate transport system substrate-binding protein